MITEETAKRWGVNLFAACLTFVMVGVLLMLACVALIWASIDALR